MLSRKLIGGLSFCGAITFTLPSFAAESFETKIIGDFFKLNNKDDFRIEWNSQTFTAKISMRISWLNQDQDLNSQILDVAEAKIQKFLSPALPANCQIADSYGALSHGNPLRVDDFEISLWGAECKSFIDKLSSQKIRMEFIDVPSTTVGQNPVSKVTLELINLPGISLTVQELADHYRHLDDFKSEKQGCIDGMDPLGEMNDMASNVLTRFRIPLNDLRSMSFENYQWKFVDWQFPEIEWCANKVSFTGKVLYKTKDFPDYCTFSTSLEKIVEYLPDYKRQATYFISDEFPEINCNRLGTDSAQPGRRLLQPEQ